MAVKGLIYLGKKCASAAVFWLMAFTLSLSAQTPEDLYDGATLLFNNEEYDLAGAEYRKVLAAASGNSDLEGRCAFQVAECAFQLKQYEAAEEAFRAYLKQHAGHGKHAEGQFRLSESCYFLKDFDAAEKNYERFLEENPKHELVPLALYAAASAALEVGRFGPARERFAKLVAEYPQHPKAEEALFNIGWVSLREQKFAEAQKAFLDFSQSHPRSKLRPEALLRAGDAAFRAEGYAAALQHYNQVLSDGEGAFERDAHQGIAWSYFKLKEYEKAAIGFLKLARVHKEAEPRALAYFQAVQSFYNAGKHEEGLQAADRLIQESPKSPLVADAWYWKGVFLRALDKGGEAAEAFNKALAAGTTKTTSAEVRQELAGVYSANKEYAKATAALEQARAEAKEGRGLNQVLYDLARNYHLAGEGQKAVATSEELLKTAGADPATLLLTRFNLGEYLFALKEYARAMPSYQTVLDDKETSADLRADAAYRMGWCLKLLGKPEPALKVFGAMDLSEKSRYGREVRFLMAGLEEVMNHLDKAEAGYRELLSSRGPFTADAYLAIAQLLFKAKRHGDLIALLDEFLKGFPGHEREASAHYLLAEAAYESAQPELALDHYTRAIALKDPAARERALYGRAWLYYKRERPAEAMADIEALFQEFPQSSFKLSALQLQGSLLRARGEPAKAKVVYEKGLAAAKPEEREELLLSLAGTEVDLKNFPAALEFYSRFIQEYPASRQLGRAIYEKGWLLMQMERPEEAGAAFRLYAKNFEKGELISDAEFALGELAYGRKEYRQALERYAACLGDERYKDKALYKLGWSHHSLNQYAEAAAHFGRLVAECPASVLKLESMYRQGLAELMGARFDKAAAALEGYMKTATRSDAFYGDSLINLARMYEKLTKPDLARARYEDYLGMFPEGTERTEAEYSVGRLHLEAREYAKAAERFERASADKTHPRALEALFFLGESWFQLGKHDEAVKAYLKTLLYKDGKVWQARSLYRIAQSYTAQAKSDKAAKYLRKLVDEFPDTEEAKKAASELAQAEK